MMEPGYFLGDHGGFGPDGLSGLDLGSLPPSGLTYLHLSSPLHRGPPAATALRNDLGSNISVLKTLNLRFRCFLAKVHELERRNKVLEKQLQQALEDNGGGDGHQKPQTKDMGVQTGFIGPIQARPGLISLHNANNSAYLPGGLLSPTLNPPPLFDNKHLLGNNLNPSSLSMDSNSNLTTSGFSISPALSPMDPSKTFTNINEKYTSHSGTNTNFITAPPPRFLPGTLWSFNHSRRFGSGRESCATGPGAPWTQPDGVGVQVDTITPEIRALNNVLAKVKRERDEYKRRWEEEYTARMDMQEKVAELEEDLQESEVCQDELAMRVKQLKAELVLFKGLVSNNLSDLDSKIQEKAMKVDMDICRRIDITARLCDVAQQRNCEDMVQMFQVATPPSTLSGRSRKPSGQSAKGGDGDELSMSESEGGGAKDEESCSTSANQINEQMQRMLNQLECEFDDDCDSLAWEETEETLLLWEDFPGYPLGVETQGEQSLLNIVDDEHHNLSTREEARGVSAALQAVELDLCNAVDLVRSLREYVAGLRDQFDNFVTAAKNMSPTVSDEYRADTQRKRKRKSQADDPSEPECELSGRSRFRTSVFIRVIDRLVSALSSAEPATKYSSDLEEEFVEEAVHFRELLQQQEESIEEVIKNTECMFRSREKEYQETIDQIELELATAKSDMNLHLHEYMEMCSMKRGLDVQMETCRRLLTQSGDGKSPSLTPLTVDDSDSEEKKIPALPGESETSKPYRHAATPLLTWRKP
ncbi:hypothetical protein KUCAC02_011304 [Chaenocephalus aceratus]|uniref:Uncharacterized protein n=1 Tax=Chaenocephalus aceratus TaxID=36190 RepID=A0ACB9WW31_CHAAC|nr:hypothetical protein KUCAC02_011304 [Chaenocephalus aceratus]